MAASVLGKWKLRAMYLRAQRRVRAPTRGGWWEFRPDGTFVSKIGSETRSEPYTLEATTIGVESKSPNEPYAMSIDELTEARLVVSFELQGEVMIVELDRSTPAKPGRTP